MVQEINFDKMMATPENPLSIRVKFYKVGMLQYISHLDLVRTMTRILVRSGIPAWYSQGFNPRLKLTFAMPLSIGTQSECEFFDIRLTAPMSKDEVKARINRALTDELQVTDVYISNLKFREIGWAEYEIKMTSPSLTSDTAKALTSLYTNPLLVTKHTKTGDKEVDILSNISLRSCHFEDGSITIRALLSADSANYLNPEYLITAAEEKLGLKFEDPFNEYYTIIRKEVYLPDMTTVFR